MIVQPGPRRFEVTLDGALRPAVQLFLDDAADRLRLQPERMAAEVNVLGAVGTRRDAESVAQLRERIGAILLFGEGAIGRDVNDGVRGSRIGRLGAASATNGATCRFNR